MMLITRERFVVGGDGSGNTNLLLLFKKKVLSPSQV